MYRLRGVVNDMFHCTDGEHFLANNILFLSCIFSRCVVGYLGDVSCFQYFHSVKVL